MHFLKKGLLALISIVKYGVNNLNKTTGNCFNYIHGHPE